MLAALALGGAVLLVVAEFLPLYSLHLITSEKALSSVSTGSHNSYALLPLALLAAILALGATRAGGRAVPAALALLGLIALLIALLGDLPDANAHGLTDGYVLAATTARAGLYVETLGAILLLLAGGAGLLAAGPPEALRHRAPRSPRPAGTGGGRSAS